MTWVLANESSMREERRTRGLKRAGWWWHYNKQRDRERTQSGGNYLAAGLVWKHCPCPCAKKQCHNKMKEYCLFKRKGGQAAALWMRETRKEEWSNQRQRSQYKHPHRFSLRNWKWIVYSKIKILSHPHVIPKLYFCLFVFLWNIKGSYDQTLLIYKLA